MCIKQNVFWMAAMAATFSMASCSLEEVVEQPASQAIGFSPFVGKPTKAVTETDLPALKTGGFKVWGGYETNTGIFAGRDVTWSEPVSQMDAGGSGTGAWGYTGTEYWVPGQTYKFAAVGPASVFADEVSAAESSSSGTTTTGTNPTFTYNSSGENGHLSFTYSQDDLTKSEDVVYAEATKSTSNMPSTAPEAVSFTFGHIMSWIKIKFVHKMTDGYKITVSDVTVTGVKTGATFTGSGASTGGWTWETTPTPSDATFAGQMPAGNLLDNNGDNCMVDFIAIPQTISGESFTISFKLQVQDSQKNYLLGDTNGGVEFSTTLTDSQTWAVNNVYVYTANLTADVIGLEPIEFDVTEVVGWPTSDSGYNEPTFPDPTQKSN